MHCRIHVDMYLHSHGGLQKHANASAQRMKWRIVDGELRLGFRDGIREEIIESFAGRKQLFRRPVRRGHRG